MRICEGGVRLSVRLTPGAAKDHVEGIFEGTDNRKYLKARVRAVPEKGKANKALTALIAKKLGCARGSISVVVGQTSRNKELKISGHPVVLMSALDRLIQ